MAMPNNLVLVRHGQSEANIRIEASKNGDDSLFTDETMMVPDRSWRLSPLGVMQAQTAGDWIRENVERFDRQITSPFIRTRETAAHLDVNDVLWEENRVVRERSWGEIDGISRAHFEKDYELNARFKKKDPLYWSPPGGESIANVAENRVRNLLSTLHRESDGDNVLVVTHGEFIWATRMTLQRWSDEEFFEFDKDPEYKIHNCTVIHYTRTNPVTGEVSEKIQWGRKAYPVQVDGQWTMRESAWVEFDRPVHTSEQLLGKAESMSRYFEGTQND